MKPSAREAMRRMPDDGKRKLLATHRPSSTPVAPLRPSKTGPDSSDAGALAGLKRFSLASVGWGNGSLDGLGQPPDASRPTTTYEAVPSTPTSPTLKPPPSPGTSSGVDQPHTPASWTSWWSAASNATGVAQVSEQAKDTPQFYVDQLRSVSVLLSSSFYGSG